MIRALRHTFCQTTTKENFMKTLHAFLATLALASSCAMLLAGLGFGFGASNASTSGPKIEGTYMLEYRETSDGKKLWRRKFWAC